MLNLQANDHDNKTVGINFYPFLFCLFSKLLALKQTHFPKFDFKQGEAGQSAADWS